MMNENIIKDKLIQNHDEILVDCYIAYLKELSSKKDSKGILINKWFPHKTDNDFINYYNTINNLGLKLDGTTITIQQRGLVFDFNAYKNLVLISYPETQFDIQLVRETDEFNFYKKDGTVFYDHKMNDVFGNKNIVGAYCVIKNKRGHFLETISLDELEKIRKTAKTDYIWNKWTSEMYLKTVIKRACKRHFKDIVVDLDTEDNKNHNLENPVDIELKIKQEVEKIDAIEDLKKYYIENKEKTKFKKSFDKIITGRKEEIKNKKKEPNNG